MTNTGMEKLTIKGYPHSGVLAEHKYRWPQQLGVGSFSTKESRLDLGVGFDDLSVS